MSICKTDENGNLRSLSVEWQAIDQLELSLDELNVAGPAKK